MALKNFFEMLNQPQTFAVDSLSLENAYQTLMARFHPDRFVNAPIVEKRVAEQVSVRINEAYQTIKNDLSRAQYLCSLKGFNVHERRPMPPAVLMPPDQPKKVPRSLGEVVLARITCRTGCNPPAAK